MHLPIIKLISDSQTRCLTIKDPAKNFSFKLRSGSQDARERRGGGREKPEVGGLGLAVAGNGFGDVIGGIVFGRLLGGLGLRRRLRRLVGGEISSILSLDRPQTPFVVHLRLRQPPDALYELLVPACSRLLRLPHSLVTRSPVFAVLPSCGNPALGSSLGPPYPVTTRHRAEPYPAVFVSSERPLQRTREAKGGGVGEMELTLVRPDDWHLHLRDGDILKAVVPQSAKHFGRAIVMPNLRPPITTTAAAVTYREEILKVLPPESNFDPLMTLYLTDDTNPEEIKAARRSGVVYAVKLYPAGATTNSQDGVTDLFGRCLPVLEEMVEQNMPLLVHGEITDPEVDVFDREKVFIDSILRPLVQRLPRLKVVMEHVTTLDAVKFVESCAEGFVAATVTPQHLLLNRNALFKGGLQPHNYCLPVLKREIHRQAIFSAVTSGSKRFFLGTDSAPHEKQKKECPCGCAGIYNAPVALALYAKAFEEAGALDKLEAFTSFNGPDFYGLPRNTSFITLHKKPWKVPDSYKFASGTIIPMFAGETLDWLPTANS